MNEIINGILYLIGGQINIISCIIIIYKNMFKNLNKRSLFLLLLIMNIGTLMVYLSQNKFDGSFNSIILLFIMSLIKFVSLFKKKEYKFSYDKIIRLLAVIFSIIFILSILGAIIYYFVDDISIIYYMSILIIDIILIYLIQRFEANNFPDIDDLHDSSMK